MSTNSLFLMKNQSTVSNMLEASHATSLDALVVPSTTGVFADGNTMPVVSKTYPINGNIRIDGGDLMIVSNLNSPTDVLGYVYQKTEAGWVGYSKIASITSATSFEKTRNVSALLKIVSDTISTTNTTLSGKITTVVCTSFPELEDLSFDVIPKLTRGTQFSRVNTPLYDGHVLRNVMNVVNPYQPTYSYYDHSQAGQPVNSVTIPAAGAFILPQIYSMARKIGIAIHNNPGAMTERGVNFNLYNNNTDLMRRWKVVPGVTMWLDKAWPDDAHLRIVPQVAEGDIWEYVIDVFIDDPILGNAGQSRHFTFIQGNIGVKNISISGSQLVMGIPKVQNYPQVSVDIPVAFSTEVFELYQLMVCLGKLTYVATSQEFEEFMQWYTSVSDLEIAYAGKDKASASWALLPLIKTAVKTFKGLGISPADILRKGVNFGGKLLNSGINYLESSGYAANTVHAHASGNPTKGSFHIVTQEDEDSVTEIEVVPIQPAPAVRQAQVRRNQTRSKKANKSSSKKKENSKPCITTKTMKAGFDHGQFRLQEVKQPQIDLRSVLKLEWFELDADVPEEWANFVHLIRSKIIDEVADEAFKQETYNAAKNLELKQNITRLRQLLYDVIYKYNCIKVTHSTLQELNKQNARQLELLESKRQENMATIERIKEIATDKGDTEIMNIVSGVNMLPTQGSPFAHTSFSWPAEIPFDRDLLGVVDSQVQIVQNPVEYPIRSAHATPVTFGDRALNPGSFDFYNTIRSRAAGVNIGAPANVPRVINGPLPNMPQQPIPQNPIHAPSSFFDSIAHASSVVPKQDTVEVGSMDFLNKAFTQQQLDEERKKQEAMKTTNAEKTEGDREEEERKALIEENEQKQEQPVSPEQVKQVEQLKSATDKRTIEYPDCFIDTSPDAFKNWIAESSTWAKNKLYVTPHEGDKSHSFFILVTTEGAPAFSHLTLSIEKNVPSGVTNYGNIYVDSKWKPTNDEINQLKALLTIEPSLKNFFVTCNRSALNVVVKFDTPRSIEFDGNSWFGALYAAIFAKDKMVIYECNVVLKTWNYPKFGTPTYCVFLAPSQVGDILSKIQILLLEAPIVKLFKEYTGSFTMVATHYTSNVEETVVACTERGLAVFPEFVYPSNYIADVYLVSPNFQSLLHLRRPYLDKLLARAGPKVDYVAIMKRAKMLLAHMEPIIHAAQEWNPTEVFEMSYDGSDNNSDDYNKWDPFVLEFLLNQKFALNKILNGNPSDKTLTAVTQAFRGALKRKLGQMNQQLINEGRIAQVKSKKTPKMIDLSFGANNELDIPSGTFLTPATRKQKGKTQSGGKKPRMTKDQMIQQLDMTGSG